MGKFSDKEIGVILRGARAYADFSWPGKPEVRISVRILTDGEVDEARQQAQVWLREWAKRRGYDPQTVVDMDPQAFDRAVEREIVRAAFFDPTTTSSKDPERFFATSEDVRQCSTSEVHELFQLYVEHQRATSPLREAAEEEVTELEEALGKGQIDSGRLLGFERSTLVRLLVSMARRRATSPTNK